jgi:hypothetical protein
MNSTVRTILFWALMIGLAAVVWQMAFTGRKSAAEAQSADARTVIVGSVPTGADIYVDGKFVGDAPATLTLVPGKHTIRLSLNTYKDWRRDLSVRASSKVSLNAALEKN